MTSPRSSRPVLTANRPIFRARSRRYSFKSVMMTLRAPFFLQMAAAMMPIGPAPVTSTSSPTTSNCSAVWVALP